MRALTVRNPWAWAIVHGGKDVENRALNIAGLYRGTVAIHAGQVYDEHRGVGWGPMGAALRRATERDGGYDFDYGCVIGLADLVDVHRSIQCVDVDSDAMCSEWAMPDHHHLVLANPRPLARPIPWRGALGLWNVPDDLEAAIREQVPL